MHDLRIGIFTHNYPLQYGERKNAGIFLHDFAQELSKKCTVYIFSTELMDIIPLSPLRKHKNILRKDSLSAWNIFSPITPFRYWRFMQQVENNAKKFVRKYDINFCLAAWAIPSGVIAERIKKEFDIPYGIWSLGSDINIYTKFPYLKNIIIHSIKNADINFANSYALKKQVKILTGKNAVFLPALTTFTKNNRKKIHSSRKIFRFLYVGRLEKIKGIDILLKAAIILKSKDVSFTLQIAGSGTLEEEIRKVIHKNNLNNVILLGNLGETETVNIMLSSDYLVIPSRSESLPLVLLEAAKLHLPIIASDVGDCPRIIRKYKIGIIVKKNDPYELALGMKKVMQKNRTLVGYTPGFKRITADFTQRYTVHAFLQSLLTL